MNPGNQHSTHALNAVSTGFVGRLAGSDVGINLLWRQRAKRNVGTHHLNDLTRILHQRDGGQNLVSPARHGLQHTTCVSFVCGFHQNLMIQHAGGVRSQHNLTGIQHGNCTGFFQCQAGNIITGQFCRQRGFVHRLHLNAERHTNLLQ